MEPKVRDILEDKGRFVLTIPRSATVYEAISKMVDHNVGSIVVLEEGEVPSRDKEHDVAGIFTERDYLRKIVLKGRSSKTTAIEEVMTEGVICVDLDYTTEECLAVMTEQKCRHLPVIVDGELDGLVSIGDCVKIKSEDAEARVRYLRDYIEGKYPN